MLGGNDRQPELWVQGASAFRVIQDGLQYSVNALLARGFGLQCYQCCIVIRALLRADALGHPVAHHDLARLGPRTARSRVPLWRRVAILFGVGLSG